MKTVKMATPICRNNFAVDCSENIEACAKCGWNPNVSAERFERIKSGNAACNAGTLQDGKTGE